MLFRSNNEDAAKKGRTAKGDKHGTKTHPEKVSRGDNHYSKTHPEKLARGDKNGARLHPEKLARGDRSGSRLHPEKLARGENHTNSKLSETNVREIRVEYAQGETTLVALSRKYGVSHVLIDNVVKRKAWKHI